MILTSDAIDWQTSLTTLEFASRCQTNLQSCTVPRAGLQSWNFLFNAVKLTPAGGVIGIGIRLAKVWVKIDVADSGREIEADDVRYVFCAFKLQQHDNATGLGLGLYIARRILELHAGTLSVTSKRRDRGEVCDSVARVARWAEDALIMRRSDSKNPHFLGKITGF